MAKYFIYIINRAPLLTKSQVDRLASIFSDIAQIAVGSMAIPLLLGGQNISLVVTSVIAALFFWTVSVSLSK